MLNEIMTYQLDLDGLSKGQTTETGHWSPHVDHDWSRPKLYIDVRTFCFGRPNVSLKAAFKSIVDLYPNFAKNVNGIRSL